jgi:hypothetical protein
MRPFARRRTTEHRISEDAEGVVVCRTAHATGIDRTTPEISPVPTRLHFIPFGEGAIPPQDGCLQVSAAVRLDPTTVTGEVSGDCCVPNLCIRIGERNAPPPVGEVVHNDAIDNYDISIQNGYSTTFIRRVINEHTTFNQKLLR